MRFGRAVSFDQDEAGRIIGLLDHVEARDPRLQDAVARVGNRGLVEGLDALRLDVHVDKNDEHCTSLDKKTIAAAYWAAAEIVDL